mmetsp:Transcript_25072/g.70222  ORF Transcript_25072/g.70222 Transcript_25072/m.70222 type:complete len:207 (-) Transcript_25072:62-682(-)|eukprot:CAMPEP_0119124736 /NCGR_PEP_ID=MMETSP1310-20130426/4267_1 /TAXON_ID=464262 /ORGANISM="Genus nov. species nov., Strain RCC2339" /LENGTH=206 /DNA_ID=CAMNT_0007114733 /DNA_START=267 /DNA_END=890 /DNA_ORIENTATION=+
MKGLCVLAVFVGIAAAQYDLDDYRGTDAFGFFNSPQGTPDGGESWVCLDGYIFQQPLLWRTAKDLSLTYIGSPAFSATQDNDIVSLPPFDLSGLGITGVENLGNGFINLTYVNYNFPEDDWCFVCRVVESSRVNDGDFSLECNGSLLKSDVRCIQDVSEWSLAPVCDPNAPVDARYYGKYSFTPASSASTLSLPILAVAAVLAHFF